MQKVHMNGQISGTVKGAEGEQDQSLVGLSVLVEAGENGPAFSVEGCPLRVVSKQHSATVLGEFGAGAIRGELNREHWIADGLEGSAQVEVSATLVRGIKENDQGEPVEDTRAAVLNVPSRMVIDRGGHLESYQIGSKR